MNLQLILTPQQAANAEHTPASPHHPRCSTVCASVQIYMELAGLGKGDVTVCQTVHAEQVQFYEAGLAANRRIFEWA